MPKTATVPVTPRYGSKGMPKTVARSAGMVAKAPTPRRLGGAVGRSVKGK